ncbi:unnamed protein product [Sphagnum troendelagicum]
MRRTSGRKTQDGRWTEDGWKSNECRTNVERKSNESPTDIGRVELSCRYCDGRWRCCTATPGNTTLRRGR